ncbi:MAG: TatD family hydrolase [Anaerolineae bacterium]|nr:TatD family hydrolase [Anaerolineae bacterium]
MTITLVDTHCHLDFDAFDDDRDEVILRAIAAGVTHMVVPAVDFESMERVLKLAEQYQEVYAAVGLHPNDIPADRDIDETIHTIRQAASHPKVVAIGEIGLDYYWDARPPELQKEWLVRQLDLAADLKLPVILHNREATSDIIKVLTAWIQRAEMQDRPGVLHSFSATWKEAQTILDLGFFVGFTGPITYKKANELRRVAAHTSIDRILLETDAPFLTPHPHRGKRNEPAYVRYVAEKLAEVRGTDLDSICRQTSHNAHRLFGWYVAQ